MMNRCGIFKKINFLHLLYNTKAHAQEKAVEDILDKEKIETAVCLEGVLTACYKSLVCRIHNRDARKEFLRLSYRSMIHQRELMKLLDDNPDSAGKIEAKSEQYLSNLSLGQMTVVGTLNLAIGMAAHTMDIYKYLSRTTPCYGSLLDSLVQDNAQQIDLLNNELDFHQHKLESI